MPDIILIASYAESLQRFKHLWINACAVSGAGFLKERSFDKLFRHWNRKVKSRTLAYKALGPCPASMQGNYATYICQADARAFKFGLWMETLEYPKEPVDIIHVKPCAIVLMKKISSFPSFLQAISISAWGRLLVNLTALDMILTTTSFSSDSSP